MKHQQKNVRTRRQDSGLRRQQHKHSQGQSTSLKTAALKWDTLK